MTNPLQRHRWTLLFVVPLAVRLAYHVDIRDDLYMQWNLVVSYVNDDFARDIAAGGGPWTLHRSPWYPLLLSWVYGLGGGQAAMQMLQGVLGSAACVLVYVLARRLAGHGAALVSWAIASLYGPALFYEGELLEQACATFLLLAGLAALTGTRERVTWILPAAGGLLFGAAALLRPDHAAAIPLAAAALFFRPGGGRRAAPVFLAAAGAMLLLMAWPGLALNVRSNHARINTALAFYLGNRAGADGHRSTFPGGQELRTDDPAARADHMTGLDLAGERLAEAAGHRELDAQAPYWLGLARADIARDPAGWLRLLGRKALMFFNAFLITTQKDLYVARDASWILSCLIWAGPLLVPLGLVLPLAAAAVAGRRPGWDLFVLLSVPASCLLTTLVFTHDARFQHAGAMVFVVLAGAGVWSLRDAVRRRRWIVPVVAGLALVLANADLPGIHHVPAAEEYFRMGTMHLEAGRPQSAAAAFLRSIEADPAFVPSLDNLAGACRKLPSCDEELATLRRLQDKGKDNFDLAYTVADLLQVAGRTQEAREAARHAISLAPQRPEGLALLAGLDREAAVSVLRESALSNPQMAAGLGQLLREMGRLDEAAAGLTDALRVFPDDLMLMGELWRVRVAQGRHEEEEALYRRIQAKAPDYAETLRRHP